MNTTRLVISVVVVLLVIVAALVGRRSLGRMQVRPEQRQRTRNVMRYSLGSFLIIALVIVWADQLTNAALVASGFAVAIVLFHKDLIVGVLGWWLKTVSGSFRIGDRIRIGDVRGDVIDYGVLSTTLIEVDPGETHGLRTGNVVTVPNGLLLTEPVVNETRILGYEWQELDFLVSPDEDWADAERVLTEAAFQEVDVYRTEVQEQLAAMEQAFAFHPIHVDPRCFVAIETDGSVRLQMRIAVPSRRIRSTSDRLVRAFLGWRASTNS